MTWTLHINRECSNTKRITSLYVLHSTGLNVQALPLQRWNYRKVYLSNQLILHQINDFKGLFSCPAPFKDESLHWFGCKKWGGCGWALTLNKQNLWTDTFHDNPSKVMLQFQSCRFMADGCPNCDNWVETGFWVTELTTTWLTYSLTQTENYLKDNPLSIEVRSFKIPNNVIPMLNFCLSSGLSFGSSLLFFGKLSIGMDMSVCLDLFA